MDSLFSVAALTVLGTPLLVSVLGFLKLKDNAPLMRKLSAGGAAVAFLAALVLGYGVITEGSIDRIYAILGDPSGFHFSMGVWVDRLSVLSVLLITSIGLVVQRYSVRYLDGDPKQGRFFSWLSFVLFSVTLFVVSRNLLGLTLSWFMVSSGVHQLLLHFSERESAQKAAWRKFVISRVGDLFLVAALVLTYTVFGTFELKDIFEIARNHGSWDPIQLLGMSLNPFAVLGSLYVLGAMTKSAQFPFHIWLPDTMETPTPVSALMHAGIINAGGFLIVRLSPLVGHASAALHLLFILGALTALFGGLIYLVQTDAKRSLAYSTIAQMGYMMMQCGLGAFAAAVLHLIMHGYYKAHAFLSAAGRVDLRPVMYGNQQHAKETTLASRLIAGLIAFVILVTSIVLLNIDVNSKPGGIFLCLFLWISALQALAPVVGSSGGVRSLVATSAISLGGMVVYWTLLGAITQWLGPVLGADETVGLVGDLNAGVVAVTGVVFVTMYALVEIARISKDQEWSKKLYVLCLNHFYVEQAWRKVVLKMLGKSKLMPSFETLALEKDIRTYH